MTDTLFSLSETERVDGTGFVSSAVEKRGIQNEGGFLTPYYLFDLMARRHADDLDLPGGEAFRYPLKRAFQQAQKQLLGLAGKDISFQKTWTLWYRELFTTLGFENLHPLVSQVETKQYSLVPISHAYYAHDEEEPLLYLDLHPFGTDLDHAHYPNPEQNPMLTNEPISRALEFALDHNQTRWAILSNGVEMRLYRRGGSVARQYLKVDFVTLFSQENDKDWLVFWGLFRLASFLPHEDGTSSGEDSQGRCLLDRVIDESQRHATKIADDLRENIVLAVEHLLQGIIETHENQKHWNGNFRGRPMPDPEQLQSLFQESIYFLYRLLFVLYAESRDLLPVGESPIYRDTYSLEHLRDMAEKRLLPEDFEKTYYIETLRILFKMLYHGYPLRHPVATSDKQTLRTKGSTAFRIPPYNGRLFDVKRTHLLDQCTIPDRTMHQVIRELSLSRPKRRNDRMERYSYADLGVDQLGSIYEGLLVFEPSIADQTMVEARFQGEVRLISQDQADELDLPYDEATRKPAGTFHLRIWGGRRKGSGSYYTPQEMTAFLVKDALSPLVEPIIAGCAIRDEHGNPQRTADEILAIKVCDPAMGSGAFLVQACRFLGEAYGRALVAEEKRENTRISAEELSKLKRRVAEKCIYGVDLNPLAVELAKVSLWLETLSKDRPLTFLDAHLLCGNALIGAPLRDEQGKLDLNRLSIIPHEAFGKSTKEDTPDEEKLLKDTIAINKKEVSGILKGKVKQLTLFSGDIEQQVLAEYEKRRIQLEESDEDKSLEDAVALVHKKDELLHEALTSDTSLIRRFKEACNLWCTAWFWPVNATVAPPTTLVYHDVVGDILELQGLRIISNTQDYRDVAEQQYKELRFFHWELEFPEIWFDSNGTPLPNGGFDVVIGNPPWDTIVLNSKEFWSNYLPTFRTLGKQDAIQVAKNMQQDPDIRTKWQTYQKRMNQQTNILKLGKIYSYQGHGQPNTYKLFLERMTAITKPGGIFSGIIPSGIYTDKYCVSLRELLFLHNQNRYLISMENRGGLFPIHSSFKVVLVSGQKTKKIPQSPPHQQQLADITLQCLFLVGTDVEGHDLAPTKTSLGYLFSELDHHLLQFPLPMVRDMAPKTLSLMEFKNQRDIDLTSKIYRRYPLLGEKLADTWNILTRREFHMTDNSNLFNTEAQGWPLWEGKMIYQFECDYNSPRKWIDEQIGIKEITRKAKIKNYQQPKQWQPNETKLGCHNFRMVYRKVASNTNETTLIVAILPPGNFIGNSIDEFVQWKYITKPAPQWVSYLDEANKVFLMGLLNSFVLNYIVRQKVSSNINVLEQLPAPRFDATDPVCESIVPLVASILCKDVRFAPLWNHLAAYYPDAMEQEWTPQCVVRDTQQRGQIRAKLDAIIADLYGLDEHDFAYILNTFPLLDRDQPPLPGEERSFITRDFTLLTLFELRGTPPPPNIVDFFAEAGADIRYRTGAIVDLTERVSMAIEDYGAVAYQPSRREKEESDRVYDDENSDLDEENEEE